MVKPLTGRGKRRHPEETGNCPVQTGSGQVEIKTSNYARISTENTPVG